MITMCLKTTTTTHDDGTMTVERDRHWQVTEGIDTDNFDWLQFVQDVANETFRHMDDMRRSPSTVQIQEVPDHANNEDDEDSDKNMDE